MAINKSAPYKTVLTQGLVVDENGRKQSKSLGNVISPQKVWDTLGADILRLWVASTDFRSEMAATDEILKINGLDENKQLSVISFSEFNAHNPAFDIKPNHLISGIITEKGIFKPEDLKTVYS